MIRLLALGGTPACGLHEVGVMLIGAVITGQIDLRFAICRGLLVLHNCRLTEMPRLDQARLLELSLQGSHFPGLSAHGAKVKGNVFLRDAVATGTVVVASAEIGGQLVCEGATLNGGKGKAPNAQAAKVTGDVFLDGVTATGTVAVNSAVIRGQLVFEGATLNGGEGDALNAQGARVEQAFMFREVASVSGQVDLSAAHVGDLADDAASWAKCADIVLDGFSYDRISGDTSPKSYAARADWLAKGSRFNGAFFPQPYTQFARVMRDAGHAAEARRALMERDRILFAEADKADRAAHSRAVRFDRDQIWLRAFGRRLWSGLSRRVVGYGHRPEYALFWALAATLFGAAWYGFAWRAGVMVPNSAVILTSPDWLCAMLEAKDAPAEFWTGTPSGQHYETFYALPYALDVFVPLVSLGEDQAWAATTATWGGFATRWFGFVFQIAGWVVTSLGIAAVTGFVQRGAPD
ncbi:hypothetical protein [Rhodobacter ferrooxidans]|uniref:Membrane-associated oxidoreductase n=1 Tax=Rhodobacter ferrooxidans TaxID=371731 RepID=C8S590_9RHOB|nr:hypothetical protein [Rhodobacter sp. SW2]EEW23823.1 conserved hypothetical protein [Rhodobacter sp. SW2]